MRAAILSFGFALFLPFTSPAADIAPTSVPVPSTKPAPAFHTIDTTEIERRIARLMSERSMVGLSVAIVEGGDLTYAKGFGTTRKGGPEKVTADTVFRWASVSKGVAAATLVSLSEDGKLDLAAPVKTLAPSLALPESPHDVTIEDILSHRVGIVRNAYDNRIEDGQRAKLIRASLKDLKNLCAPGTCHTYQNVAFDSAAEVAETVTGLPYKAVVSERVFKPLGMKTASLTHEGLIRSKNWAKPHTRHGIPISTVKPTYYRIPAAAGVNSSVVDLAKWMTAQMQGTPDALPKTVRDTLQTPRVDTPREARFMRHKFHALQNSKYGLGWRIYDYNGHKVVGHRGGVEGYRALVLFDPEIKTGVALMWNSSHSEPIGLQLEIMDQIYGQPRRDWMRLNRYP